MDPSGFIGGENRYLFVVSDANSQAVHGTKQVEIDTEMKEPVFFAEANNMLQQYEMRSYAKRLAEYRGILNGQAYKGGGGLPLNQTGKATFNVEVYSNFGGSAEVSLVYSLKPKELKISNCHTLPYFGNRD